MIANLYKLNTPLEEINQKTSYIKNKEITINLINIIQFLY